MTAEETALRSPHNGNMTVLARMGVPGAVLWIALNLSFVIRMLVAFRRASSAGLRFWSSVNLFVLCLWLATMINQSFDVYIEGPMGGMWFWAIIGFGLAALRVQRHEARLARSEAARLEMAV
jgi:O-antigen ligase